MLERIYLAGFLSMGHKWCWDYIKTGRADTLESFWNASKVEKILKQDGFGMFLDSGAYSWHSTMVKKGIDPDDKAKLKYLDDYIAFIHKHKNRFHVYCNLDVVGNPELSLKNQKYMESNGLDPLPVFHYSPRQNDYREQDKDIKYLKKMVEEYDYIALGGGASEGITGDKYMKKFGDPVFRIIHELGKDTKVHGFGVTSVPLMLRYPWYSVDSTTWLKVAAYGGVIVPRKTQSGEYDYNRSPTIMSVSDEGLLKQTSTPHYALAYSEETKNSILEYFEHIGVDIKEMGLNYIERQRANVIFFENFMKHSSLDDTFKYLKSNKTLF